MQMLKQKPEYYLQAVQGLIEIESSSEHEEEDVHVIEYKASTKFNPYLQLKYAQNYGLIILLLSLCNKQGIVGYRNLKEIQTKNGLMLRIQAQKGHPYDVKTQSFNSVKKQDLSGQELFKLIRDVCKGLISLTEMKIIHLDVKRQNIIKTKDSYKLIDFDVAVFLGLKCEYINHRNYLCGSQFQKVQARLFENTRQIWKSEIEVIKNTQEINESYLTLALNAIGRAGQILQIINSNFSQKQKIDKICAYLNKNIDVIHSIQLRNMLSNKQIQKIDKYRWSLLSTSLAKNTFKPLQHLFSQLLNKKSSFSIFLSQFICEQDKKSQQEIINIRSQKNLFTHNIYRKSILLFWENVIELKLKGEKQYVHSNWNFRLSQQFEIRINKKIKEIFLKAIIPIQGILQASYYSKSMKLTQKCGKITEDTFGIPEQSSLQKLRCILNPSANQSQDLIIPNIQLRNYEKDQTRLNIRHNFMVCRLIHLNYLTLIQKAQHIHKPERIVYKQLENNVVLYYPRLSLQWPENLNNESKLDRIWSRGIPNIIKFFKQTCKGIQELEKQGLYHSQLKLDNIISCFVKESNHPVFRINNLEKTFYFNFDYKINQNEFIVNSSAKMILSYLINDKALLMKQYPQIIEYLSPLNSILMVYDEIIEELYAGINQDDNNLKIKKIRLFVDFLRENYNKFYSQWGSQLLRILNQGFDKANDYIPPFLNQKCRQLQKLTQKLRHEDLEKRLSIYEFSIELNKLFPSCEITNHQDELVLYYYLQQKGKTQINLCNLCLKDFANLDVSLMCLSHSKHLKYVDSNEDQIRKCGRRYFCEECCTLLQHKDNLQIIDPRDLCSCEYICLGINCQESLISHQNLNKNHVNHHTLPISQYKKINRSFDAFDHDNFRVKINNQGHIGHFQKISIHHANIIRGIFNQMQGETSYYEHKLQEIIKPNALSLQNKGLMQNQSLYWKIIKIFYRLYLLRQKKSESSSQYMTIQGYIQYCNDIYDDLARKFYPKIQQIFDEMNKKLEESIFSPIIQQKMVIHLKDKYKNVINNQVRNQIAPLDFQEIPVQLEALIENLWIERPSVNIGQYYKKKMGSTVKLQQLNQQRAKAYQKWIERIGEDMFCSTKNNRRVFYYQQDQEDQFLSTYTQFKQQLQILVLKEKDQINEMLKQMKENPEAQYFNIITLKQRQKLLQFQKKELQRILACLSDNCKRKQGWQSQQYRQVHVQWKNVIDETKKQLAELREITINEMRIFSVKKLSLSNMFKTKQIQKLCRLCNLRELTIVLTKNYANHILIQRLDYEYVLTARILEKIIGNNPKLKKIAVKGGQIQYFSCLSLVLSKRNDSTFVFHVDTNNLIKTKEEYQQLDRLLGNFNFPCFNIKLRKDIDEQETHIIMRLLDRAQQVKLQVEGPLMKNGRIKAILNKVVEKKGLFVTALTLKKFKIGKNSELLTKIAKKCGDRLTKIKLFRCLDYNSIFLLQCKALKEFQLANTVKKVIERCFISSLFQCSELQSLRLYDCNFEVANLSLQKLCNLKDVTLRYCTTINDNLLETLPHNSAKSIESLNFACCHGITNNSCTIFQKMSSLKSLMLGQIPFRSNSILRLATQQLENLNLNHMKQVNTQLMEKISQKWPKLSSLGIVKCIDITFDFFKSGKHFKILRNIRSHYGQFKPQQKILLNSRGIHVQEYN